MQMMRLFSVAAAYLLFVNSLLAADSFTSEELRAALDQWAQDLEFRSSFVYREGRANSQMDAFDDDPISHMTSSATGLFHKAGTTIRYSFVPDDGPKIVGVPDANGTVQPVTESASGRSPNAATGQVIIRGASQDEIYNKDLILTYSPAWKQFYDRATFTNRSATPGDSHQAVEPSSVDRLSPMNPVPGCSGGFPGSMQGAAAATEYVVENIDDTHVAVL